MAIDIEQLERSFATLSPRLDELTMLFYTELFGTHPEIRPLFARVDLVRQRRKLAAMLTLIVTNLSRMDILVPALRSLGERHIAYGALPEHYAWTEEALMRSLARALGDAWDAPTERAWAGAIALVTAEMQEGAATIANAGPTAGVQSEDLDLLMEIASNPALSFGQNSLFASYIEKKQTDHEMTLARTVQQSLIPPAFPDVPGYRFAASYEPAKQVGGDYYDWVMPDEEHVCLVFGDVSGKGLPGALIMCRLAGAVRALLSAPHEAEHVLPSINAQLCDRMPAGRFITLAFLEIHLPTHRVTLANAGHLPPLLRRPDGSSTLLAQDVAGIPVGIERTATYGVFRQTVEPGQAIVLYTDGVTEAVGTDRQQYGVERLRTCVASAGDPTDIGPALLRDVHGFASGRPQHDDLTVLVIARDGS
jgi:serine phosphatase RsbU (regulator of sigma subunit)